MKSSKKSPVLWPTTLYGQCWLLWFLITAGNLLPSVYSEVLTPPYFNIAENRRITATATCGDEGQERYCKLVGANSETGVGNNIINGQVKSKQLISKKYLIATLTFHTTLENFINIILL